MHGESSTDGLPRILRTSSFPKPSPCSAPVIQPNGEYIQDGERPMAPRSLPVFLKEVFSGLFPSSSTQQTYHSSQRNSTSKFTAMPMTFSCISTKRPHPWWRTFLLVSPKSRDGCPRTGGSWIPTKLSSSGWVHVSSLPRWILWMGTWQQLAKVDPSSVSLGSSTLECQSTVIDLEVIIDNQLTLKDHVRRTCIACLYQLRQLRIVRRALSSDATCIGWECSCDEHGPSMSAGCRWWLQGQWQLWMSQEQLNRNPPWQAAAIYPSRLTGLCWDSASAGSMPSISRSIFLCITYRTRASIPSKLVYCNNLLAGISDTLIRQLQSVLHVAVWLWSTILSPKSSVTSFNGCLFDTESTSS